MTKTKQTLITAVMVAALVAQAIAQQVADALPVPPPSAPPQRSAADLEKLAAPMALYPDPLIAIMLPAAAYPLEIVQAARFVADTNNLPQLDAQSWDDNVKAVAKFPSVIKNMSDDLTWTIDLGQAFVQQPSELMDAIQALRSKAQSVGTLQTTPQQVVIVTNSVVERTYETQVVFVTNTVVQIVPANPQVIYVPVYSPTIVYAPPPTYVYNPISPLVVFGVGIAAGIIIANNHCDWHYGGVYYGRSTVVVYRGPSYGRYPYYPPPPYYRPPPYYPPPGYRPPPPGYRPPGYPPPAYYPPRNSTLPANGNSGNGGRWQPDQNRIQKTGAPNTLPSASTMEARGWSSGTPAATTRPANGNRAGANSPPTRPGNTAQQPAQNLPGASTPRPSPARPSNNTPAQSPNGSRPSAPQSPAQPAQNQPVNRPQPANRPQQTRPQQGSAYEGVGNGAAARGNENRGASSRSGGQSSGRGNGKGGR